MTEDPAAEDWRATPQHILDMRGREAWQSMLGTIRLIKIVAVNGSELLAFFKKVNEPTAIMKIWRMEEREGAFEQFLDETERLLFNFLNAAYGRVESYRGLMKRGHLTGDLLEAYRQRVDRDFVNDPLHNWLIRLRNYMLHSRLPVSTGHLDYSAANQQTTVTVSIDLKNLVSSADFNAQARSYMEGKESVNVPVAVRTYLVALKSFDDWFLPAYWAHHHADIDAYREAWDASAEESWRRRFGSPPAP